MIAKLLLAVCASLLLSAQAEPKPGTKDPAPATPPAAPAPAPKEKVAEPLRAVFTVPRGTFTVLLHTKEAPMACANFVNLIQRNYYKDQPFDNWTRVIRQAEGPIGLKSAGYGLRREFSASLLFDRAGRMAFQQMTNSDEAHPTIFFITTKEQPRWNLVNPIFATVESGQDVVDATAKDDKILSIALTGDPAELLKKFDNEIKMWNEAIDKAIKANSEAPKRPRTEPPAKERQPAEKPATDTPATAPR